MKEKTSPVDDGKRYGVIAACAHVARACKSVVQTQVPSSFVHLPDDFDNEPIIDGCRVCISIVAVRAHEPCSNPVLS